MKEIALPITQTFSMTIDTHNIDRNKVVDLGNGMLGISLGSISSEEVTPKLEIARKNGGNILYATTSIEQQLESILLLYFMGPFIKHDDRRQLFEREILQSSTLSFSAKKELVFKIAHNCDLLDGEAKEKLQKQLKKIMGWRNAFAHGKMQYDNRDGCLIKYYSGGPKHLELNDEYWSEVEITFKECSDLLSELLKMLESQSRKLTAP